MFFNNFELEGFSGARSRLYPYVVGSWDYRYYKLKLSNQGVCLDLNINVLKPLILGYDTYDLYPN